MESDHEQDDKVSNSEVASAVFRGTKTFIVAYKDGPVSIMVLTYFLMYIKDNIPHFLGTGL